MPQSPITAGGNAELSVMPHIQFADPSLFSGGLPQLMQGAQQGISEFGQLQQQQDIAQMHPLQIAAAKLQLSQPVDVQQGESFQASPRIGPDGQPLLDDNGQPMVDIQKVHKVTRYQMNPTTGQIEAKNIDLPGEVLSSVEQQQQAKSKAELNTALGEKAKAVADVQGQLADAKSKVAETQAQHAAAQAKWLEDKAAMAKELNDIKKQHEDTYAALTQARQDHWNDAIALKKIIPTRGVLPNGQEGIIYTDSTTGQQVAPPVSTGMTPIPTGRSAAPKQTLGDIVGALRGNTSTSATPAPAPQTAAVPQNAVAYLKAHPETAAMFDQRYGAGASKQFLTTP